MSKISKMFNVLLEVKDYELFVNKCEDEEIRPIHKVRNLMLREIGVKPYVPGIPGKRGRPKKNQEPPREVIHSVQEGKQYLDELDLEQNQEIEEEKDWLDAL